MFCFHSFFSLALSSRFNYILLFFLILSSHLSYSFAAKWTDKSGKHTVEGQFLELQNDIVIIKCNDGKQIKVALDKLNQESQDLALKSRKNNHRNDTKIARDAKLLEKIARRQRSAVKSLGLYQQFLSQKDLAPSEKEEALENLSLWQQRANQKLWRWDKKWLSLDDITIRLAEEERLLKEAHRLIEINNHELARERFELASAKNPEGIRGNFYLAVLHLLIGKNPKEAEKCFSICIKRIENSRDRIFGSRRSNLIAAYNNRAICRVRRGEHNKALKDWNTAIRLAPLTPELVQNLGYYAKLAGIFSDWGISKNISKRIANYYADVTVANQAAAFQENTGWLLVPYVDSPQLPNFVENSSDNLLIKLEWNAEIDTRVVDWATSFAVSNEHLVTSLSAVKGAYGLLIFKNNKLQEKIPGKIIATTAKRNLALLSFNGLDAAYLQLSEDDPRRAAKVRAISYPEPGLLLNGHQTVEGTVIDLRLTRMSNGSEYTTNLIHDLSLSNGSYGSPLINLEGKVVGIDHGPTNLPENYRSAASCSAIRNFLLTTELNFPSIEVKNQVADLDIEDFTKNAAKNAVFSIAIVGRVPKLSWSEQVGNVLGIRKRDGWNGYEDRWCAICDGLGEIPCSQRDCMNGQISIKETYIQGRMPITNEPIHANRWHREPCTKCKGTGVVSCPHCNGRKTEPTLN